MNDTIAAEEWDERDCNFLDPTTAALQILQRDVDNLKAQVKRLDDLIVGLNQHIFQED